MSNDAHDAWQAVVDGLQGVRLAIYDDLERLGRSTVHDPAALAWLCEHCLVELTPHGAHVVGLDRARRNLEAKAQGRAVVSPDPVRPAVSTLRTPAVEMAPRREKSGQLSFFGA